MKQDIYVLSSLVYFTDWFTARRMIYELSSMTKKNGILGLFADPLSTAVMVTKYIYTYIILKDRYLSHSHQLET